MAVAFAACAGVALVDVAAPEFVSELAAMRIRAALADAGFPDAQLRGTEVGLEHTRLASVELGDGITLRDVDIDAGLTTLVGRGPTEVTIREARAPATALARAAHRSPQKRSTAASHEPPPVERIRIDHAVVTTDASAIAISATVTLAADGPLAVDAVATSASLQLGATAAHDVALAFDGTVDLDKLEVRGHGTLTWQAIAGPRGARLGPGALALDARDDGYHVTGHADAYGGHLALRPFVFDPDASADAVVDATGLHLDAVVGLGDQRYVTGTGTLDGQVVLRVSGDDVDVLGGSLAARTSGDLQLVDKAWRDRLAGGVTDLAIHRRIAGALADFSYTHLDVALAAPGSDPEMRLVLRGRGKRITQELDLAVNLRNVRRSVGAL